MNRASLVALGTGAIITSAAAIGIGSAHPAPAQPMSRSRYEAALARIERARPLLLARCAALAEAGREACEARVAADEIVRVADLDLRLRGTPQSAREAQRARIEARYLVARAGCAALGGIAHDRCLISAHAARGRALLESQEPYVEARGQSRAPLS